MGGGHIRVTAVEIEGFALFSGNPRGTINEGACYAVAGAIEGGSTRPLIKFPLGQRSNTGRGVAGDAVFLIGGLFLITAIISKRSHHQHRPAVVIQPDFVGGEGVMVEFDFINGTGKVVRRSGAVSDVRRIDGVY